MERDGPFSSTAGIQGMAELRSGKTLGNGKIVNSVASNALTISIKTLLGGDPVPTNPVFVSFTNTDGTLTDLKVTTPTSLLVPSGARLGSLDSMPFRVWLVGFNDGGTLRLGVTVCLEPFTNRIYSLTEQPCSSTAISADAVNAGVIYTEPAVSSKAYVVLGYLDWSSGLGIAGSWKEAASLIRNRDFGGPKPGDKIQEVSANLAASSGSGTIPWGNSSPQRSEGDALLNCDIAPISSANLAEIEFDCFVTHTVPAAVILALFRDPLEVAIESGIAFVPTADAPVPLRIVRRQQMETGYTQTYRLRIGGSTAGTWRVNATASGNLGGTMHSVLTIREIMG